MLKQRFQAAVFEQHLHCYPCSRLTVSRYVEWAYWYLVILSYLVSSLFLEMTLQQIQYFELSLLVGMETLCS